MTITIATTQITASNVLDVPISLLYLAGPLSNDPPYIVIADDREQVSDRKEDDADDEPTAELVVRSGFLRVFAILIFKSREIFPEQYTDDSDTECD